MPVQHPLALLAVRAASVLHAYPLSLGVLSAILQNAGWWKRLSPWADGSQRLQIAGLTLATGCIAAMFSAILSMARLGMSRKPLRAAGVLFLLVPSACGIALGWYNVFRDEYYLEDCYYADWRRACLQPRYRSYDVLYDLAYRDTCVMARMGDPTSLEVKERQCYVAFTTRLPLCLKVAGQCLVAAVVIGGLIVADSQPLTGLRPPDEATMLAEAQVEERMQGSSPAMRSIEHRRPALEALGDED
mmetsp:Transcript_1083/g.3309  ORF Transcript_1083/g.3309 Transcript_1083/m.3309 type:complete len:245 (+) Transcript_1083:51-785(+)